MNTKIAHLLLSAAKGDVSLQCCFSVKHATFINGYHVLNVDEGVFTSMHFEQFQSLLDQVAQVVSLPLGVINLVSEVFVLGLVKIQHRQDLSVVGH